VSKQRKSFSEAIRLIGRYALLALYHLTFGLYLRVAYNLRRSKDSQRLPKGAFVLLGNHCNNYDGPFLQCLTLRPSQLRMPSGNMPIIPPASAARTICRTATTSLVNLRLGINPAHVSSEPSARLRNTVSVMT
jgi:hypothetical protein